MPRIAIIGAGSGMFSLSLVKDICLTPGLRGSTVAFMDLDAQRLEAAFQLCSRYAREAGADLRLERTTDRIEALTGADFVINTALAESHEHWREGWSLAMERGYRFGGSFHVVHDEAFWINFYQLRLIESVLEDMLATCPDALYVLVSNPVMAGVTYLTRKYPRARVVGLCHGFRRVYHLTDALGLEREHVTYEIPGINHFVWLTQLRYRGENAFPRIDRWIETQAREWWERCPLSDYLGPKAVDLYQRFGVFPIGDTSTPGGGAWGYWYHTDAEVERRWREDPVDWFDRYFAHAQDTVDRIRAAVADPSLSLTATFGSEPSGETMIPLIDAMVTDTPRVLIVNVPNTGEFVPGIPRDFAVEIPALVSARGIQGIQTGGLPQPLLSHALRDRVAPVETELVAYARGDYESLLQLVLMDPFTRSEAQARDLIDAIFRLPYHEELKAHYRPRTQVPAGRA